MRLWCGVLVVAAGDCASLPHIGLGRALANEAVAATVAATVAAAVALHVAEASPKLRIE